MKKQILKFISRVRNREIPSNKLSEKQTYSSSVEALKMIYYVIIGLAIKEALMRTFLGQEGNFLGTKIFKGDNLISFLLLVVFLFTIVRFVHGASIHLEMDKHPEKTEWKPLWDFAGFLFHGSLFYMMAVSLKKLSTFLGSFAFMVFVDAVWITIPCKYYIKKLDSTHWQWLISDIIICVICLIFLFVCSKIIPDLLSTIIILVIAIGAAILDYFLNMRFYFPKLVSQK